MNILISGPCGLIGTKLSEFLKEKDIMHMEYQEKKVRLH